MLAGGAHFADGLKDLLQQRELVRRKGVAGDKLGSVFVAAQADGIADKAELVVDDIALASKGIAQQYMGRLGLGEQAFANHFVGVAACQRQPRMKTPLNLGEVLRLGLVRLANGGVDVFLAGDDDPGAALALRAQLLGDGLQAEHELRIGTDKLTHLIHQKDHLVVGRFGSKVVVDDLGKAFDVDAKVIAGTVKPLASRLGRHLESLGKRHHDVVTQEIHGVALLLPGAAVGCCKGGLEDIESALGDQVALHVGDVRSVARVA